MLSETIRLYPDRDDVTLTTYLLADSPEMLAGRVRPAVIVCPGGAYLFCSDREGEPIALRFAAMGCHAFVLRYSVANRNRPDVAMEDLVPGADPLARRPSALRDLGCAMALVKDRAAEWKVDADRIAICGFSAGGHLCADYATHWHAPVLSDHFGRAPETFRPVAAILGYPVTDYLMERWYEDESDPFAKRLHEMNLLSFFGTVSPSRDVLEDASPARRVDGRTPPMFLWATSEDALVPVEQTLRMAAALAQAKVPFEAHVFESGPHGLATAKPASASSRRELDRIAAQWMDLAEAWLEKRMALPLLDEPAWPGTAESAVEKR